MKELALAVKPKTTRTETHIICEPIVLETLHVLSRHCNLISRFV